MKRLLLALLLLAAVRVFGATGDVVSVSVEANGWVADVTVSTVSITSSNFNFGFLTNNSGVSKMVLTVTSPGFDDSGNTNTATHTIYSTRALRQPYPNNSWLDVTASGGNALWRLSSSDYFFPGDTATYSLLSGALTSGGVANNAGSGTVTINASDPWPKCIAMWANPGFRRLSTRSLTLKVAAFHASGQMGRPVRAVAIILRDQHGWASTNWAALVGTMCPITGLCVCEYSATADLTGATDGDFLRGDYTIYPWWGDSNAVLSTLDNANVSGPLWSSQTNWLDLKPTPVAVVSWTNSGSGVVVTNYNAASPPAAFSSIGAAVDALAATNLAKYNRNTRQGIIYVRAGNYNGGGSVNGASTNFPAFLDIARFQGDDPVVFTNSDLTMSWFTHFQGCQFVWTNGGTKVFFNNGGNLGAIWLDNCFVNWNADAGIWQVAAKFFTDCTMPNFQSGFLRGFSTGNGPCWLLRGCLLGTTADYVLPYCVLGNWSTNVAGSGLTFSDSPASTDPRPNVGIIAFNRFSSAVNMGHLWASDPMLTNGFAVIQNVFEKTTTTDPLMQIAADTSSATNVQNVLFINNTCAGERLNWMYDNLNSSTSPLVRKHCVLANNLLDRFSIVSDQDLHNGNGQAAQLTNNWPEYYGVGHSGNMLCSYVVDGDFTGLNTWAMGTTLGGYSPQWMGNASYTGTKAGAGDYRTQSSSDVIRVVTRWYLPRDITGAYRCPNDPPGAYASANPKKSGSFFGKKDEEFEKLLSRHPELAAFFGQ